MKTLRELEDLLVKELVLSQKQIEESDSVEYYNELTGDVSVLLTSILEEHLLERKEWDSKRWLDDSLLTKIELDENIYRIWGIVIWGKENTLSQWTAPFYFEIRLSDDYSDFKEYTFLFGTEENRQYLCYEEFNEDRGIWDKEFYSNDEWDPSERDWKFIINSKND